MLKWPDAGTVHRAVSQWAAEIAQDPNVLGVGYFGSYARGDWGVGSDLDIILVLAETDEPFMSRSARWDTTRLPVPADVLVYTLAEWRGLDRESRFGRTLDAEVVWIHGSVMRQA